MQKSLSILLLFSFTLIISAVVSPAFAGTDCYRDCRARSGCSDMSDYDCSGVEMRCQLECRHQEPEKSYGAIAYSAKNGSYGYSNNFENRKKAEQTAMKYCKQNGSGCKVAVWFYNSCGAVAAGKGKVTWGQNDSGQIAAQEALKKCEKGFLFKRKCEVVVTHCSF